jgi:hypothetical protein
MPALYGKAFIDLAPPLYIVNRLLDDNIIPYSDEYHELMRMIIWADSLEIMIH